MPAGLAALAATPDAATNLGYPGLTQPGVAFVITLMIALFLYTRTSQQLTAYLRENRARRIAFFVFAALLLPLVVGGWADIIDISEVLGGVIQESDVFMMTCMAVITSVYVYVQLIWFDHADSADAAISAALLKAKRERGFRARMQWQRDFCLKLISVVAYVVGAKSDRVRACVREHRTPQAIREILDPETQLVHLVQAVYGIYKSWLERHSQSARLRVVYFRPEDGHLVPVHSWNGRTRDCINSPVEVLTAKLDLSDVFNSVAVYSAIRGSIEAIEDTELADKDPNSSFRFFGEEQREYLKSMMAIPLTDPDGMRRHVIVLDTDQKGFFRPSGHKECALLVRENIEQRLFLEIAVSKLLP